MKKILALALAAIMALSLVTIAAAEEPTDFEELVDFNFYYPTYGTSNEVNFQDSPRGTTATPAGNFTVAYGQYTASTTNDYLTYTSKGADNTGNGYISMPYLSHYFGLQDDGARLLSRDAVVTFSAEVMAKQKNGAYMDFLCLGMDEDGSGIEAETIVFGADGKHASNTEISYEENQWYKVVFEVNTIADTYKTTIQAIINQDGGNAGNEVVLSQGTTKGIKFRGFRIAMGATESNQVLCVDNIKTEGKILLPSYNSIKRNGRKYVIDMAVNKLDSSAAENIKITKENGEAVPAQVELSNVTRPYENSGVNTCITITPESLEIGENYNIVFDKNIVIDNKFNYSKDIVIPITYEYTKSQVIAPLDGDAVSTSQAVNISAAVAENTIGKTFLLDSQEVTLTGESGIYSAEQPAGSLSIGKHTFEVYSYNADGSMNYDFADFDVCQDDELILDNVAFNLKTQTKTIGDSVVAGDFSDTGKLLWYSGSKLLPKLAAGKSGQNNDYALNVVPADNNNKFEPSFGFSAARVGKIVYSMDIKLSEIKDLQLYLTAKGSTSNMAPNATNTLDFMMVGGKLYNNSAAATKGDITGYNENKFVNIKFVFDTINGKWYGIVDGDEKVSGALTLKSINTLTLSYYLGSGKTTNGFTVDNMAVYLDADVEDFLNLTYNDGISDKPVVNGYIPSTAQSISFELPYMIGKNYVNAQINTTPVERTKIATSKTEKNEEVINMATTQEASVALQTYISKATINLDGISANDVVDISIPKGENYAVGIKQGSVSAVEWKQFASKFETKLYVADENNLYINKDNVKTDGSANYSIVKVGNASNTAIPMMYIIAAYDANGTLTEATVDSSVVENGKKAFGGLVNGSNAKIFLWNSNTLKPY